MTLRISPAAKTAAIDAATFFAGSLICKATLFSWLNGPVTPAGIAFCSGVNALTISAANQLGNTDFVKTLTLAGLIIGSTASYLLAKPLARYTNIVISPFAALQLGCFHFVIKTTAYSAYYFALNMYQDMNFNHFSTAKDLKDLPSNKLGSCKAYFEKHEAIWDAFPLKMQAAFNVLMKKNGLSPLTFSNLTGEDSLTKEELEVFLSTLGTHPTKDEMEVLRRNENKDTLPIYHRFFTKTSCDLSPKDQDHFATNFYKLSLPPPTDTFIPHLDLPKPPYSISKTQALYYVKAFEDDFSFLSIDEQILLSKIFAKCGVTHDLREPTIKEIPTLTTPALEKLKEQYEENSLSLWEDKKEPFQTAFNQALEKKGYDAIPVPNKPMPTWQKVGIVVAGIALIALGIAVFPRQKPEQKPKPEPKLKPNVTLTPPPRVTAVIPYQPLPNIFQSIKPPPLEWFLRQREIFQVASKPPSTPSRAVTVYTPPLNFRLKSHTPTVPSPQKTLLKEPNFSYINWATPIIGLACMVCCSCKKKKPANQRQDHLPLPSQDFDTGDAYDSADPTWNQAAAQGIALNASTGTQLLPNRLYNHDHKITYAAGPTKITRWATKTNLNKLPGTIGPYLSSRKGWQAVAKAVDYVAFDLLTNPQDIFFEVTQEDSKVRLIIDASNKKVNLLFDSIENLENLNPESFDIH